MVGPAGGTVVFQGLTLDVPPGALAEEVEITVQEVSATSAGVPSGFLAVGGTVFDLRPEGLTFLKPFALTLRYSRSNLPAGVGESELGILHITGGAQTLPSTVDAATQTVRAMADHFSTFAVGLEVGELQRVACPTLGIEATSGVPLDVIPLGRAPESFEQPLAAVVTAGDTLPEGFALINVDAEGNAEMVVPIHPSTDPNGGPVRLNITDGTRACAGLDFTVEPLPEAPGELAAITDEFQAIINEQAALLETTPEALISTPVGELPPVLVPLALLQSIVDHPDNDRSLRSIADGTWPDAATARLDLVEPLLARTGLRTALAAPTATASRVGVPAGSPSPVSASSCSPGAIGSDASLLNACMEAAASAQFRLDGASGKVLNSLGRTFAVLGFVPALGTAAAVGGAVAWAGLNEKSRTAALLPSTLTGMTIKYDPADFLEDEDGPGSWYNAQVTATNLGWDLGKEVLEGLLQGAGVVGAFDKFQVGGPEVDGVVAGILSGPVAAALLGNGTVDDFQIPVETFGPVDVSDEAWSTSRIAAGDAITLVSHTDFEPRKPGSATLSVRTADGKFGGQQVSAQAEVTVGTLQVTIAPTDAVLAPDEVKSFDVTVTDSKYPSSVELFDTDALQGSAALTLGDGGSHYVTYVAPSQPDASRPDLLIVRHTAQSGARQFSTEERVGIATIRFGKVVITAGATCLDPDQTTDFDAQVVGLVDQSVEWTADVGTIDPATGAYTAPPTVPAGGIATITARSTKVPSLVEQISIRVGGCSCNWDLNVDGNPLSGQAGDGAGFQIVQDLGLWNISLAADNQGSVGIVTGGVAVGMTGSFDANPAGNLGLGSGDLAYSPGEAGPASLLLTENDGDIVEGTVNGTVTITTSDSPPQMRQAPFSASFRIVSDGFPVTVGGTVTYSCTVDAGAAASALGR